MWRTRAGSQVLLTSGFVAGELVCAKIEEDFAGASGLDWFHGSERGCRA